VTQVVQRTNVRMRERGDRARLALEAGAQVGIARDFRRKDLDRDGAIEPRVPRAIDLAHAAAAQRGEDLVGAESSAGSQGHVKLRTSWTRSF